jgi:Arc/MetJ family transcription regulator
MEVTVSIDDELYGQAMELAEPGINNASDLFHEAQKAYVRIQAGRRLAALNGKAVGMQDIPRNE